MMKDLRYLVLVLGSLAACANNEPDEARRLVDEYCHSISHTYDSLLEHAGAERYALVEQMWVSRDSFSNLTAHSVLCINASHFPRNERAKLVEHYLQVTAPVTRLIASMVVEENERTSANKERLLRLLGDAREIMARIEPR
jgi:hypothetical protein